MTVMTVEHNAAMRKVLRDVISMLTDNIVECDSCGQALAWYALARPDVVIIDIDPVAATGFAGVRELLALDAAAWLLAVSQFEDAEYREQARSAGMRGYFVMDRLDALLEQLRALEIRRA